MFLMKGVDNHISKLCKKRLDRLKGVLYSLLRKFNKGVSYTQ
jgi:hypothetical protein